MLIGCHQSSQVPNTLSARCTSRHGPSANPPDPETPPPELLREGRGSRPIVEGQRGEFRRSSVEGMGCRNGLLECDFIDEFCGENVLLRGYIVDRKS